jgi:hypothetical protein
MRGSLVLLSALFIASPVVAASGISPRYDGVYAGEATAPPGPPGSTRQCPDFTVERLRIAQGIVSSGSAGRTTRASNTGDPAIKGFITEEGFLSGTIALPGNDPDTIEGRLEDGVLVAGIMDHGSGCSWVLKLRAVS